MIVFVFMIDCEYYFFYLFIDKYQYTIIIHNFYQLIGVFIVVCRNLNFFYIIYFVLKNQKNHKLIEAYQPLYY